MVKKKKVTQFRESKKRREMMRKISTISTDLIHKKRVDLFVSFEYDNFQEDSCLKKKTHKEKGAIIKRVHPI